MFFNHYPFLFATRFAGRRFMRLAFLSVAALAMRSAPAKAVDYTWNNTTANWNAGGNWTPAGGPPTAADNAFLLGATAYSTTLSDNRSINNLTINNASATLALTAGAFTVGGTITMTAGTFALNNGTISGGSITTGGGTGRLLLGTSNNNILNNVAVGAGVLDFSTGAGRVRLQGTTSLAVGTALNLSGSSNILAFEQTSTLNNVTINVSSSGNGVSVEGTNTLTLGPATTVEHSSGFGNNFLGNQFFTAGANTVLNQGLIRNTGAGIFNIAPTTFTNQSGGIVRATAGGIAIASGGAINTAGGLFDVNGGTLSLNGTNWSNGGNTTVSSGTLNLGGTFTTAGIGLANLTRTGGAIAVTGTMDNTAATLALTAGTGSFQLNGGTISGGAITFAGGATLQPQFNNNNRLVNVAVGAGVIDFGAGSGRVRLQGSTSLASGAVLNLFNSNILAFEQTATVTGATINVTSSGSSVTVEGTNTMTFGAGTTVEHTSGFGNNFLGNQGFVTGTNTLLNQGLIRNTGSGTFNVVPTTFTNQSGGIVRATAGGIVITSGGAINTAGGLFDVNGGTLSLNGTNWSNGGNTTVSSGTLNLGGTFTTAGIGLANLTRTGGAIAVTGTMDNTAATLALTAGTGSFQLNGGTISGGAISFAGGATLQPLNNNANRLNNVAVGAGVIDFGTAGGRVRLQGTTSLSAGTVLNLSNSNILAFDQTATVGGATINVSSNGNSVTVEATNVLTLGSGTTVDHSSGFGNNNLGNQFLVTGANTLLNQGLIRNTGTGIFNIVPTTFTNQSGGIVRATAGGIAITSGGVVGNSGSVFDVAGGFISLNGTNWSNTGTLAVSSGTLNLGGTFATAGIGSISRTGGAIAVTGTMDNSAATLALTGGTGSFQINGGTISGGSITFAGGATLQPLFNNNNRLNNVALGAGVIDFGASGGRLRLQGTTSLASGTILNLFNSNILAFEQTATVNGATINVSSSGNSVTVDGTNTLTLGPGTTIDHSSGFGNNNLGNQFLTTGANTLLNQGLIRNTGTGIFNIVPTTFTNTGTVRVSAGGIAIPVATNLTNFAGNTLTGGTWEAVGTGNINLGTRTINTIATGTTVTLDGAGSVFAAINPLATNNGMFNVLGGRTFAVSAPFTNAGTITVGTGSSLTAAAANAFTLSGGTLTGAGTKTFAGAFNWTGTGGTISGSAPSLNGVSTFNGTTMTIDGVALAPAGGGTWSAGTISLVNAASFAVPVGTTLVNTGDTALTGGAGSNTFSVAGTFRKTAGTGTTSLGAGATTSLTGTVDAQGGTLLFAGNLTSTGVLNSTAGATLDFGGTAALNAGSYTGQGNLTVSAGTTTSAINLPLAANANLTVNGTLSMSAGAALSTQATGTATLSGGTLAGAGAKTFNGAFNWTGAGGTVTGTAPALNGVNTFNGTTMTIDGAQLAPAGGAAWTGGNIIISNNGTLRAMAGQVINASADGSITGSATGTLDVLGTFRKSAGAATTTLGTGLTVTLGGSATLESLSGTLAVTGNLTNLAAGTLTGGTFRAVGASFTLPSNVTTIAAGTTIELNGAAATAPQITPVANIAGTVNVLGGAGFTPSAPALTVGGNLNVGTGSTLTYANAFSLSGGTLTGAGSKTLSGAFNWTGTGGTVSGTAPVLNGVNTFNGATMTIDGATLAPATGAAWTGGNIVVSNGGVLRAVAGQVINAAADGSITGSATGTLDVLGTFRKNAGAATTTLGTGLTVTLGGSATLESLSGTLAVTGNLTNLAAGTLTGGTFRAVGASFTLPSNVTTIAAGTTIELNGAAGSMPQLASLATNNGTVRLIGTQNYTPTAASVSNVGVIDVGAGSTFGKGIAVVSGGTLKGNGTVTGPVSVAGTGVLAPGASPGTLTIGGGLTFTGGSYQVEIAGPTAGNYDRTTVTAGSINLGAGVASLIFPSIGGTGYTFTSELAILDGTGSATFTPGGFFNGLPQGSTVPALNGFGGLATWRMYYGVTPGTILSGGLFTTGNSVVLTPVPEPATMLLGAAAFGLFGFARRQALQRLTSKRVGVTIS